MRALAGDHVVGAGVDRRFQHGVGGGHRRVEFDNAEAIEHERHRAGLGEVAAGLGEVGADVGGGAVAVVGQRLDDDGDAAGAIALVADLVIVLAVIAGGLLDGALDIVLGHVFGARCDHSGPQPRIHRRVGGAELGRDGDFARELAKQLGLLRVLPPLAVHDVLELGMSGHAGCLSQNSAVQSADKADRSARFIGSALPKIKGMASILGIAIQKSTGNV